MAKAEAATADKTEEIETGTKRKIECLMQTNGHKLRGIEGTDTGWVRCTECGRTAGGSSEDYWAEISCNKNQCASDDYWSRKRYTSMDARNSRKSERPAIMLAIRDRVTDEPRRLTELEENRVADSRSEARQRKLLKQRIEESRARAYEIRECRKERKEGEGKEGNENGENEDREEEGQSDPPTKKAKRSEEATEGGSNEQMVYTTVSLSGAEKPQTPHQPG